MKTPAYLAEFSDRQAAHDRMTMKNRACRAAGNHRDIYCLVAGPNKPWAVVDLGTAIDLGMGYEWAF
jgi:hypothetical protein